MGLGHIRRNLLIGGALAGSDLSPNILLLSGAADAKGFHFPEGVDCVTLPSLYKETDGHYRSRRLRLSLDEIVEIRRRLLRASVEAFDPDVFVADTAPWGALGELDSTLEFLATRRHCSLVLGMRDIWDEADAIAREWAAKDNWEAIRRYYDQVWIYGDPSVCDAIREYGIREELVSKFRYTGYLGRRADCPPQETDYLNTSPEMREGPLILCLMGGGQDGMQLAEAFLECELPEGRRGLLVTGPFMDSGEVEQLRRTASTNPRFGVVDFIPEPISLIYRAEAVVSMGGYNAVCEIISFRKPALIVPRIRPRREQLIRAERLKMLGLLEVLLPQDLGPEAITAFLRKRPIPKHTAQINMGGLARIAELVEPLLSGGGPARRLTSSDEKSGQRI